MANTLPGCMCGPGALVRLVHDFQGRKAFSEGSGRHRPPAEPASGADFGERSSEGKAVRKAQHEAGHDLPKGKVMHPSLRERPHQGHLDPDGRALWAPRRGPIVLGCIETHRSTRGRKDPPTQGKPHRSRVR